MIAFFVCQSLRGTEYGSPKERTAKLQAKLWWGIQLEAQTNSKRMASLSENS